ncbi:hypothetical protein SUDANB121_03608 [Nocardiopsis dassonvillei]|uniref:hypothetical protein n=1 Tax=Nocardiopsis dassonvillei TaxID=2014 RepID=UPI003F577749
MSQFSAALFRAALGLLRALFSSPCGRHHRRRRSARVRRYAQTPGPATRPSPPAAPRLSAPRETFAADDLPLVRPYYTAHEQARIQDQTAPRAPESPRLAEPHKTLPDPCAAREQARLQAHATARLQQWAAPRIPEPRPGEGDLLAPTPPPVTFEDLADAVRRWQDQQHRKTRAGVGA